MNAMQDRRVNTSERLRLFALTGLSSFALSFAVGACFNGFDAEGLACEFDGQCGVGQQCLDGFCGGVFLCDDGTLIDALATCDLFDDCPDGEDEDVELCFGGSEVYACRDDDLRIPLEFVCDDEEDCPGGDDELGCAGVGANECSAGGDDIAYEAGELVSLPLMMPLPLVTLDLLGPPSLDVITGSRGANQLEVVSYGDDGNAMTLALGPFDSGTVVDFDVGEVNGDGKPDIVVAIEDEGFVTRVYQNDAPGPPVEYGTPLGVELPGNLQPDVQTIELARLNNDSSIDLIAVVDGNDLIGSGRLMVALGDSTAANEGGSYFTPSLVDIVPAIGYQTYFDAVAGDFSPDSGLDDIIVAGLDDEGMPGLWIVVRTDAAEDAWSGPNEIGGLMIPPAQIAAGAFGGGMGGPDLVVVDPLMGRVQALRNQGGEFMPGPVLEIEDFQPLGITLADINCDDQADFLLYHDDNVAVYLGDGSGGVLSDDPILAALDGTGQGRLAVAEYNGDGTADIVATVEGAGVQTVLSTGELFDSDEDED